MDVSYLLRLSTDIASSDGSQFLRLPKAWESSPESFREDGVAWSVS